MKSTTRDSKNTILIFQALMRLLPDNDPRLELMLNRQLEKLIKAEEQFKMVTETSRRLKIQNKKLLQQVGTMKESLKQTKLNRNQILTRFTDYKKLNRDLSDALGSCTVCWGEDDKCQVCEGNGSAGWRTINKRLFNLYVLPTMEKVYGWKK
ncbi:MAG: hypothetical protein ABWZ25_15795 [Chitinophagaceae bacterium]